MIQLIIHTRKNFGGEKLTSLPDLKYEFPPLAMIHRYAAGVCVRELQTAVVVIHGT